MDIKEIINEVQLMKANKEDLVEAMREVGIEVADNDPLRVIADKLHLAGGKSCVTKVATVETLDDGTKQHRFFTREEWDLLSSSERLAYPRIGILLIAEGHQLIISKSYQTRSDDNDATTMLWGTSGLDVSGLKNYETGTYGMIWDFDSQGNTDKIIAHYGTTTADPVAARRCREYKGCPDDPTRWDLPAAGHLILMTKYRLEINEAMNYFIGGGTLSDSQWYWSSTEYGANHAWAIQVFSGSVSSNLSKHTNHFVVRPVSAI